MVTRYPTDLDDLTNYPDIIDGITNFKASTFNNLKEALFAIEAELGVKPSGVYSTVRQRLDMLEDMLNTLLSLLTNNPAHTFVFKPGGIAIGNVYDDWDKLYADLILFAGPRIIEMDNSISACTIPSGTYNLNGNVELRKKNNTNSLPIQISMSDGAIFTDPSMFIGINILSNSTSNVFSFSTSTKSLYLKDTSMLSPVNSGHMINLSDDISIYLETGSIFSVPLSTGNVINMSGSSGATVDIYVSEDTTLNANTLSGAATESININIRDSSATVSSTQTGFFGALSIINKQKSKYVYYDDSIALPTLSVDNVQDALDGLKAISGGGGSGTTSVFVFRPGGTAVDNVYITWASLFAALSIVNGPKIVEFDDTNAPITIPAGGYDLLFDTTFRGYPGGATYPTLIGLADGASLENPYRFENVYITSNSTTEVFLFTNPTNIYNLYFDSASIITASTSVLYTVFNTLNIYLDNQSHLLNGLVESFSVNTGALNLFLNGFSTVDADTLSGSLGAVDVTLQDNSSAYSTTQTNLSVVPSIFMEAEAKYTNYNDSLVAPLLNATTVQDAIDALKSGSGVGTTFVFKPSGVAGNNVYTVWADLYTDLQLIEGPRTIEFVETCTIPAGTYNFNSNVTFVGNVGSTTSYPVEVSIADTVVLNNTSVFDNIYLQSLSSTNIFTFTSSNNTIYLNNSTFVAAGAGYIYDVAGTTTINFNGSSLENILTEVFNVAATGALNIRLNDNSSIGATTLSGDVSGSVSVNNIDAGSTYSSTQPNLLSTVTESNTSVALKTYYDDSLASPALSANNVQDAIDGLKGNLYNTFVFQPSGTATKNVYTSWTSLYSAFSLVNGPRVIEFDNSFASITIPAGSYSFGGNTELRALYKAASLPINITCSNGAIFNDVYLINGLNIISNSTFTLFSFSPTNKTLYLTNNSRLSPTSSGDMINLSSDSIKIYLDNGSRFSQPTSTGYVVNLSGAATLDLYLSESVDVQESTLVDAGTGIFNIYFQDSSALYSDVQDFTGTENKNFIQVASQILYDDNLNTPNFGATLVQTAIDAIKDHVALDQRLFYAASGIFSTNNTSFEATGGVLFNPAAISAVSWLTKNVYFVVIAEITSGFTGEVQLYNISDATTVTNSLLTVTATSPTKHITSALAIPADLPNSEKLYELQYRISVGSPTATDKLIIKAAYLLVEYT